MSSSGSIDPTEAEAELTLSSWTRLALAQASKAGVRSSTGRLGRAVHEDRDLMAEMVAGSVAAFSGIYDRYCDQAYRVALSVCHDQWLAQDAVQDGFLSVWKSRATYRADQGTVAAWLLTVVRYRAIDIARNNHRHSSRRTSDDQLEARASEHDPLEIIVERDDAQRLQESLAMLPDQQAEVITLAYYGQLSHTEIATRLGLAPGTVKGRMRLGLQKLRTAVHDSSTVGEQVSV